MPPLRRGAHQAAGGNLTAMGVGDAAAAVSGFYEVDELLGGGFLSLVTGGSSGAGYGYGTPGGVPTVPSGFAVTDFAQHPGIVYCSTGAVGETGGFCRAYNNNVNMINIGSPETQWNGIACMPAALSNATESYSLVVGPIVPAAAADPVHGIGLRYNHAVNAGCWQLMEYQSATTGPLVIANSSYAPAAKQWMKISIRWKGGVISAYVNDTLICSGTSAILSAADKAICVSLGGMHQRRLAMTSGTIFSFVDRLEMFSNGMAR